MEKNRIRSVKTGKSMRMSYQRQKEVLEMPNLIEVQKDSYQWFLDEGLKEVFDDISPIADYGGKLSLEFIDFTYDEKDAKYSISACSGNSILLYKISLFWSCCIDRTGEINSRICSSGHCIPADNASSGILGINPKIGIWRSFFHRYLIICYGICVSKRHADSVSISADLIIFYSHTFHRIYLFREHSSIFFHIIAWNFYTTADPCNSTNAGSSGKTDVVSAVQTLWWNDLWRFCDRWKCVRRCLYRAGNAQYDVRKNI